MPPFQYSSILQGRVTANIYYCQTKIKKNIVAQDIALTSENLYKETITKMTSTQLPIVQLDFINN